MVFLCLMCRNRLAACREVAGQYTCLTMGVRYERGWMVWDGYWRHKRRDWGASQLLERPSLRVRHWRDHRSGPATRETCLLMCVCLCMRYQGGRGIQGPAIG